MKNEGAFDIDAFLEAAEDYSDTREIDDFSTRTEDTDSIHELDFDIDDIPSGEQSTEEEFDFDNQVFGGESELGSSTVSEFELDSEPEEEDFESYLNRFAIEDESVEEVQLEDYNIQEDIVINDFKQKLPIKMILFTILFAVSIFLAIVAAIFFNKYSIMNENIKNSVWTNGSYSIVARDYKVEFDELVYGQTVIYVKNPSEIIKEYGFATILDEKFKSPRQIKVFFNSSGNVGYLSIEDIYYIVVTDPNNTIVVPEDSILEGGGTDVFEESAEQQPKETTETPTN